MSCRHAVTIAPASLAGVSGEGKPCVTQTPAAPAVRGSSASDCDGHEPGPVPGVVYVHSYISAVNTGSIH